MTTHMNVKIVAPNGTPTGSFFVDFDYQIKSAALRSLKEGKACKDSMFVANKSVWSFVETDGTLQCTLNESLTKQLTETGTLPALTPLRERIATSTTDYIPLHRVVENYGVVVADAFQEHNLIDAVSGKGVKDKTRKARGTAFHRLKVQASSLGANALMGVKVEHNIRTIGGGFSLICVFVAGPAVKVHPEEQTSTHRNDGLPPPPHRSK